MFSYKTAVFLYGFQEQTNYANSIERVRPYKLFKHKGPGLMARVHRRFAKQSPFVFNIVNLLG